MITKKYPYKFLDAYERKDKEIFKGRDEETEALYKMVFEADILLVYGASGTGKTSLIQCGLANKFKTYDWLALNIRKGQNINSSLDRALCAESDGVFVYEKQNEQHKIKDLNKKLETIYLNSFRPIYLIFDQFEELYILGNIEEQKQFIQHVKAILELDQPVKMIFSIREEYLGYLYDFERVVPQLLQKKLRVESMNITKVQEVIAGTTTLTTSNVSIKQGEVEAFTKGIFEILQGKDTTGKNKKVLTIQLPYLQVLLDKIYFNQTDDNSHQTEVVFSTADLKEIGEIDNILQEFLEERVVVISHRLQPIHPTLKPEHIWNILSVFVTLDGTKEPITIEIINNKIKNTLNADSDNFTSILIEILVKSKIIRYSEKNEIYEIAHDSLAAKIAEKRTGEEIGLLEAKRLIKNQSALKSDTRELLTERQLIFIEPYLEKLILKPIEVALIQQSLDKVAKTKLAELEANEAELKKAKAQTEKEKKLRKKAETASKKANLFTRVAIAVALLAFFSAIVAAYNFIDAKNSRKVTEFALKEVKTEKENALVAKRIAEISDSLSQIQKKEAIISKGKAEYSDSLTKLAKNKAEQSLQKMEEAEIARLRVEIKKYKDAAKRMKEIDDLDMANKILQEAKKLAEKYPILLDEIQ